MNNLKYADESGAYQTPGADIVMTLALHRERRRNRSLRRMLVAQAVYTVVVTVICVAVAVAR